MKPIPLTRAATLSPFVHYLKVGNGSVSANLKAVRIDPEFLEDPEGLIPLNKVSGFVDRVMRREGIEDLSLRVGAATPITSLGLFGKTLEQSLTLKDVVEKLQRYVPLLDSGASVWTEKNSPNTFRLCIRHAVEEGRAQADAFAMMLMIDAVRLACGPEWRPGRVALDLESGRLAHRHEALSDAKIESRVDYAAFEIPSELVGAPVRRHVLPATGDGDLNERLKTTGPSQDFGESVVQAVSGMLNGSAPTIEEAAEMAGTSLRTFQRRLAQDGLSYRDVLDRVRFQGANRILEDSQVKISEIASRLGYSDEANFIRAFRRWSGNSPSAYRERHLQPADA